jgi:hypothetical protein
MKKLILPLLLVIASFTACKKDKGELPLSSVKSLKLKADVDPDSLQIGLIAYYPFNGNAVDSSGNGNDGTIHGAVLVKNRFGTANSAYCFCGTSNIVVNDNEKLRLNNTDFTFNAWANLDKYGTSYGSLILSKRIVGNNNGYAWGISGDLGVPMFVSTYGPGGTSINAVGSTVVPLHSWHMLSAVYNLSSQQLTFYVDGVLDNVTNGILTNNPNIDEPMYIGRDTPISGSPGYEFNGALDDIRIYGRALSQAAIQQLYTTPD